ncbi:hypothetical protein SESBI_49134 [Sesbania bispinosa]|nr:hypothetical protein SESBI_49134 [Sesbania bispinosa]
MAYSIEWDGEEHSLPTGDHVIELVIAKFADEGGLAGESRDSEAHVCRGAAGALRKSRASAQDEINNHLALMMRLSPVTGRPLLEAMVFLSLWMGLMEMEFLEKEKTRTKLIRDVQNLATAHRHR